MTQKHRSISLIASTCSANTRVTQNFAIRAVEACHLARGFKSIGYHYYITKDGVVYPGRPNRKGSPCPSLQCPQHRHLLREVRGGGKPADTRSSSPESGSSLESLCLLILMQRWATGDLPNVHKDCPSFDVKRWLKLVDFQHLSRSQRI